MIYRLNVIQTNIKDKLTDGSKFITGTISELYNKALDTVGTIITKLTKEIGVKYSESNMCLQKEFGLKTDSPKGCLSCNHMKSSMSWIQVEPSVSTEDETTVYTLDSSAAGHYECSLSGLRWVCESKVSLRYQFSSWELHRTTLKKMRLEEGGPLMDITMISGKLEEIHLPHFVCIEPDYPQSSLREEMKVLHVKDNRVLVEEVDEVTWFHAKLLHPSFSGRGLVLRRGLRWRVHCDILIFRSTRALLTLHTYLIQCDPSLAREVEAQEKSYGFLRLPKPKPEKSVRKGSRFTLKTSCRSSITPEEMKLRSTMPNYFEVYIKDAAMDFEMELISENGESAWKAEIRTDEYRDDTSTRDIEFVDEFRPQLIQRVNNVSAIADILFTKGMISEEINANISAAKTRQAKMRVIYEALNSGGPQVKGAFFTALKEKETFLVKDLDK
ncbi:NACHT, LRR and PYD domains-containing protein 1 homolog [Coregonus clupeaformis]|uniref:NACHT, LRR and PYD domains-containing protein 1 homolog n=1 Tax=Coregonus clupeaformis TaxID=59861 RepID=UPI001BE08DAD|nr:NACHT, LRR and PYD domains-containing protein 1 homolog [Coregonus clupeaformis]